MLYLPWEWNVVHDCGGRVGNLFVQAPNDIYDAYMKSRNDHWVSTMPLQSHGPTRITISLPCTGSTAREDPFYERLLKRVVKANESEIPAGVLRPKHERAVGEDNPIRKIVDPLMPIGSRRRDAVKRSTEQFAVVTDRKWVLYLRHPFLPSF